MLKTMRRQRQSLPRCARSSPNSTMNRREPRPRSASVEQRCAAGDAGAERQKFSFTVVVLPSEPSVAIAKGATLWEVKITMESFLVQLRIGRPLKRSCLTTRTSPESSRDDYPVRLMSNLTSTLICTTHGLVIASFSFSLNGTTLLPCAFLLLVNVKCIRLNGVRLATS